MSSKLTGDYRKYMDKNFLGSWDIPDGEEYQYVEVEKYYSADNWDELQTLLMTLIDFSDASIRFEVRKEVTNE